LDNLAIARILREIADLLEIKDDNPFKIRAYRNGADIAANHPHELATLDEAGLREIPGIGKDLAGRIREIGETGDTAYHRELIAEFPPTILDLLHLQGVGRRRSRRPTAISMSGRSTSGKPADGRFARRADHAAKTLIFAPTSASGPPSPPRRTRPRRRCRSTSASVRPTRQSRRSAACGGAARRAAISTCSPPTRRPR
jgi:hypothetical protein